VTSTFVSSPDKYAVSYRFGKGDQAAERARNAVPAAAIMTRATKASDIRSTVPPEASDQLKV
jgi:hypothetical protein